MVSSAGSEDSAAMTGVVVSMAVPSTVVGSSTAFSSTGSGVFSLVAVALGLNRFPNPDRLLRFSFFSVAATVRRERWKELYPWFQRELQRIQRPGQFHLCQQLQRLQRQRVQRVRG